MPDNINIGFFTHISYEFSNIYETDNFICFTQPKIGSRVLDEVCGHGNRYIAVLGIDEEQLYWSYVAMPEETHDKDKIERFRKILNNIVLGLEKRDIIFFYRNPLNRYVSGLYQDLLNFYEDDTEESIWLQKLGSASGVSTEHISDNLRKKLIPKIQNFLDIRLSETLEWGHIIMYLSGYMSLIHRSKMTQGSRVFLFNIEGQDMNDILHNYIDTSKFAEIHKGKLNFSNRDLKNLIEEEFYGRSDDLLDVVRAKLKHEMTVYQLLRSSSLNYYTNKRISSRKLI